MSHGEPYRNKIRFSINRGYENSYRCSPATIKLIDYWQQTNGKRKAADIFGGKPGGCDEIMEFCLRYVLFDRKN